MALVEEKYVESTDGIKKTIDKGSMSMALDILQRGLYAHPIQSTVRELASNGYDAIKERDVAKEILLGNTNVEDHYDVTKVNGIFHSSGWDPSYFDINWLSSDPHVYLYYEEGTQKDLFRIVDHGVGLGKTRLVNYFMLNWSSKRSNKDTLGNKGLGSKVALSLGVTSFRVTTKYNGKKFKFDVFLDKVESIIPKFGSNGQHNEPFILVPEKTVINEESGEEETIAAYVAYCESTADKNGVEIQVEIKKHNKNSLFEAVEQQLMYMPGMKFMYKDLGNTTFQEKDIAAKILYRDSNVVISESTVYDKPHILLGTGDALISYGHVSFAELELEPKRGSVGLILDINDIEVTPSRESPIWSAKTRAAVLAKYKLVSEMASAYLNKELSSEHDYLVWITKAAQILGSMRQGGSNGSVLSRLASIIDMDDIGAVTYPDDTSILFDTKPKEMFGNSLTIRNVSYLRYQKKIERKALVDLCTLTRPIYFTKTGSNPYRDRYLYEENGDFILINIKDQAILDDKGTFIVASSVYKDYDIVVVPEDRMDIYLSEEGDLGEEEDTADAQQAPKIDYSANRKVNKQIVIHTVSGSGGTYNYKFSSRDVYISELFTTFQNQLIMYTTGGDRETMSNILSMFPQSLVSCNNNNTSSFYNKCKHAVVPLQNTNTKINGVLLAQENVKYVAGSSKYLSVTEFMVKSYNSKSGLVTFTDLLKFTATNSVINSLYVEKFSGCYEYIHRANTALLDPELFDIADFCYSYYNSYHSQPLSDIMKTEGFIKYVTLFNLYKSGLVEASEERIEELLVKINSSVPDYLCDVVDEIIDIDILDLALISKYVKLFDYYSKHKELIKIFASYGSYNNDIKEVTKSLINYFKLSNSQST